VSRARTAGTTRTYYIAADQVSWDYVPGGVDEITGQPFADTGFFRNARPRPVGTAYLKALYREYTDSTFRARKPRPPAWEHLGFLGPVMHAEVGDTIRVVFRNNASHPFSIHPHGVFYNKDSEGALYADGTSGPAKADDAVPPGGTHVYIWPVPERAGPGPGDPSSIMWMYHSHTDEIRDVNSGLMGAMIVTARGQARPDGTPADVDRELVTMFSEVHEDDSWYADQNLPATLARDEPVPNPNERQADDPYFVTFSINGFTRGTLPLKSLTMRRGERVRWYLFASINDDDSHTPHWHGNTVLIGHMRTDMAAIAPMEMVIADMVPDNVGTWLFHCHVSPHLAAGMQARYGVADRAAERAGVR
jgi:FtsP/CotA-like multicopper oxidase with cupredoxin domain